MKSMRRPLCPKETQSISRINENNGSYEISSKKLAFAVTDSEKENYQAFRTQPQHDATTVHEGITTAASATANVAINNGNEGEYCFSTKKNFSSTPTFTINNISIENYLTEEQMKSPKSWFDLIRSIRKNHSTKEIINYCLFAFSKMNEKLLLNDRDYLIFCFLYLHLLPDKEKVQHCFEMYSRGVGRKSAQFYNYWAHFQKKEFNSLEKTLQIIQLGIENEAEPMNLLKNLEESIKVEISKNLLINEKSFTRSKCSNGSNIVDTTAILSLSSQSSSSLSSFSNNNNNRGDSTHKSYATSSIKISNSSSPIASKVSASTSSTGNNAPSPSNNDTAPSLSRKATPSLASFSLGGNFRGGAKRQIISSSSNDTTDTVSIRNGSLLNTSIDSNHLVSPMLSSYNRSNVENSPIERKIILETNSISISNLNGTKNFQDIISNNSGSCKLAMSNDMGQVGFVSSGQKTENLTNASLDLDVEKSLPINKSIESQKSKSNNKSSSMAFNGIDNGDYQHCYGAKSSPPSISIKSNISVKKHSGGVDRGNVTEASSIVNQCDGYSLENNSKYKNSKNFNIIHWSQACNLIGTTLFVMKEVPYMKLCEIGKGGSSRVYKVLSPDFHIFALKVVSFEDQGMLDQIMNEVKLLISLRGKHRNIIELFDASINFEKRELTILLEHAEVDLHRFLMERHLQFKESQPFVSESSILKGKMTHDLDGLRFYWKSMLTAVKIVHDHRIVHGDLKPTNFVLVKGHLKLIDFGIAKAIGNNTMNVKRDDIVGTLNYMSPESVMSASNGKWKVSLPSDVWSLGCILYQMVFGTTPFEHIKNLAQKLLAISGKDGSIISIPQIENSDLYDVIKSCLQRNPSQRPKIPDLLVHPFLSGSVH